MKKFLNQTTEIKALIISSIATVLGFLGTMFLFWSNRGDIPFGVLTGGGIILLSWLILYLSKKNGKETIKLDIFVVFLRLGLLVAFSIAFALVQWKFGLYIISPVSLIIAYLVTSLLTLLVHLGKEKECSTPKNS